LDSGRLDDKGIPADPAIQYMAGVPRTYCIEESNLAVCDRCLSDALFDSIQGQDDTGDPIPCSGLELETSAFGPASDGALLEE
jgi:hypothetical protein